MKIFRSFFLLSGLLLTLFLVTGCGNRPVRSGNQLQLGPGPEGIAFDPADGDLFGGGMDGDLFGAGEQGFGGRGTDLSNMRQTRGLLEPIFFKFDRSGIQPGERGKIQDAVAYMNSNPQVSMLLEGHTDWRGTTEYNMGLGDRRATSVYDFMVSMGISSSRLEILSRGDLEAVSGGTEEQMRFDRRVEFVVLEAP